MVTKLSLSVSIMYSSAAASIDQLSQARFLSKIFHLWALRLSFAIAAVTEVEIVLAAILATLAIRRRRPGAVGS